MGFSMLDIGRILKVFGSAKRAGIIQCTIVDSKLDARTVTIDVVHPLGLSWVFTRQHL